MKRRSWKPSTTRSLPRPRSSRRPGVLDGSPNRRTRSRCAAPGNTDRSGIACPPTTHPVLPDVGAGSPREPADQRCVSRAPALAGVVAGRSVLENVADHRAASRPRPCRSSATVGAHPSVTILRRSDSSTARSTIHGRTMAVRSQRVRAADVTGIGPTHVAWSGPADWSSRALRPPRGVARACRRTVISSAPLRIPPIRCSGGGRTKRRAYVPGPAAMAGRERRCCHVSGVPASRYTPRLTGSSCFARTSHSRVVADVLASAWASVTSPC